MFSKRTRFMFVLVFALVLAVTSYAFAAANVVPESGAGDGSKAVSGYTITNVHYTVTGADVSAVSFAVTPTAGAGAASMVKVTLDGTNWATCSLSAGTWNCSLGSTPVTVLSATNLRVIAVQ
jgi:hypothetical protein